MSFSIPWRCGPQGGVSSPDHGDVLGAAFGEPDLAGASQDLAHVGAAARQGKALELLARGIEAEDRVAGPLAGPHLVAVVHVDGIGVRVVGGRLVRAPLLLRRVVHRDVAARPLAHPDAPAAIAPDAPRALVLRGRLEDRRLPGRAIDLRDERARERAPPDVAGGCRADAVGAAAARRIPHRDLAALHRDLADHAALPGEPEVAV